MNYEIAIRNNILIVSIYGDLDDHVTNEIRENIDYVLCKKEIKHLIFDLSKVTFMDSAGIGLFMGRYRQVKKRGGECAIISTDEQIIRILRMSGILSIFDLFKNIKEGINKYENR